VGFVERDKLSFPTPRSQKRPQRQEHFRSLEPGEDNASRERGKSWDKAFETVVTVLALLSRSRYLCHPGYLWMLSWLLDLDSRDASQSALRRGVGRAKLRERCVANLVVCTPSASSELPLTLESSLEQLLERSLTSGRASSRSDT
jgi:hypothetical protein